MNPWPGVPLSRKARLMAEACEMNCDLTLERRAWLAAGGLIPRREYADALARARKAREAARRELEEKP